jgi:hypothetical protein
MESEYVNITLRHKNPFSKILEMAQNVGILKKSDDPKRPLGLKSREEKYEYLEKHMDVKNSRS